MAKTTRRDSSSKPGDLVTPTIKSALYTTGRGGSGNMARNDPEHPEIARAAQDVEAPPGAVRDHHEAGPKHFGRGGAANVIVDDGKERTGEEERERLVVEGGKGKEGEDVRGLGEKARDLLGKIKK
ncbi:uncharacterized protein LTHEOB_2821 [Neofusicoccum parvum]|uniref:Uncharacterized protein n=2 Tax=Neofusicoccum parvum TaxID=310453 RepID=R1G2Q2_BOTPV|nr:hypothetical protein UCRNP2_7559 [Neofusicoccum parvum UCRNP2]GME32680.1 uncharacterized protein LTHEOB_2821 [Neofusicoccum parvum]GME62875.1 uncharacterized protein LTHEOB_2821 [Neofusicoccum parvum]